MNDVNARWQDDWTNFIHEVAKLLEAKLGDEAITKRFGNQEVTWEGKVDELAVQNH